MNLGKSTIRRAFLLSKVSLSNKDCPRLISKASLNFPATTIATFVGLGKTNAFLIEKLLPIGSS